MFGRWFAWVIGGAVVALGVFAGLDALRSSIASTPSATEAVTTTQAETRAEIKSSASLVDEQLVKLTPGRVRTDRDYRAFDSLTVPPGWTRPPTRRRLRDRKGTQRLERWLSNREASLSSLLLTVSRARSLRPLGPLRSSETYGSSTYPRFALAETPVEGTASWWKVRVTAAWGQGPALARRERGDLAGRAGDDSNTLIIRWGLTTRSGLRWSAFSCTSSSHRPAPQEGDPTIRQ